MDFTGCNNETSFNRLLTDSDCLTVENELLNATKIRKSKTPKKSLRSQGKENKALKENETKKVGRVSTKKSKEPLKAIAGEKKTSSNRKSAVKSPEKKKKDKKTQTVPKIIIYKDNDLTENKVKKNSRNLLPKSLERRRSLSVTERSSKVPTASGKKSRHSFNDLSTLGISQQKEKSSEREKPFPKLKQTDPEFLEMISKLEILFPRVDPDFLKTQFVKFKNSLTKTIEFILSKEKTDELPTKADYLRRLETEKLQNKFLESFSVENFLKMIPNPWEHFLKADRQSCDKYYEHSLHYLKNKFKKHYIQAIQDALSKNKKSLYLAHKDLIKKKSVKLRMSNRSKYECDMGKPLDFNLDFIQEVAFIENENIIKAHIKKVEAAKQKRIEKAQKEGTFLECHSCSGPNLLKEDVVICSANHVFCKDCVVKYIAIETENARFQFKCLLKCTEKFSLESLQTVLSPLAMAQIIKRNKLQENKLPGIEDLVCCPFCYYVTIMPPELTVVKCLNPKCLMETCRHCKQLNHIPLKCHGTDKSENKFLVENETKSLLRCVSCNNEFVRGEDSNRMECSCGDTMCSVCRQPFSERPLFKEPPKEPKKERPTLLSSSSEDSDYTTEEAEELPRKSLSDGDLEGDGHSPTENFKLLLSGSEAF